MWARVDFLIGWSLWRRAQLPTGKVKLLKNRSYIRAEISEGRKALGWGRIPSESWVGSQMVGTSHQKLACFFNASAAFSLNEERMKEGGKERKSSNLNLTFWNFLRSQFISTLFLHKSEEKLLIPWVPWDTTLTSGIWNLLGVKVTFFLSSFLPDERRFELSPPSSEGLWTALLQACSWLPL